MTTSMLDMYTQSIIPVKKTYVLGFCLTDDGGVVLIHWNGSKELWQRGKYNGIGGSVLFGESPTQAMVREFKEETGIDTTVPQWQLMALLSNEMCDMFVFRTTKHLETFSFEYDEGTAAIHRGLPDDMEQSARWLYLMCTDASAEGYTVAANLWGANTQ